MWVRDKLDAMSDVTADFIQRQIDEISVNRVVVKVQTWIGGKMQECSYELDPRTVKTSTSRPTTDMTDPTGKFFGWMQGRRNVSITGTELSMEQARKLHESLKAQP